MIDNEIEEHSASGVAILETAEGLRLELPVEPEEIRTHLRDSTLETDPDDRAKYQSCFAAWLWDRWRATLEPAGVDREAFVEVVSGYRREIWLWLLGDRLWEQLLSGLAGRVSRRLAAG